MVGRPTKDVTLNEYQDSKLRKIFQFIGDAVQGLDLGFAIALSDVVDLKILSVDDRMRGRGIAGQLYQQSEKIARDAGFKVQNTKSETMIIHCKNKGDYVKT